MENASKALLIAAAILVVIILIAVGIKIYSSTTAAQKVGINTGSTLSDKTEEATQRARLEINYGSGPWKQNKTIITNSITKQELQVGDIVKNYNVSGYSGQWGILGVENGNLLLISTKGIQKNVVLTGKQGYLTGINQLNTACMPYKNEKYASSARSVKVEDLNKVIGYIPESPITYTYTLVDGKVKRNDKINNSSLTTSFSDANGTILTSENSISVEDNFYTYKLENFLGSESKAYNLLKAGSDVSYWLASKFSGNYSDYFYGSYTFLAKWGIMNYSFRINGGYLYESGAQELGVVSAIRAVIVLKSDIQLSGNSSDGWTIE